MVRTYTKLCYVTSTSVYQEKFVRSKRGVNFSPVPFQKDPLAASGLSFCCKVGELVTVAD